MTLNDLLERLEQVAGQGAARYAPIVFEGVAEEIGDSADDVFGVQAFDADIEYDHGIVYVTLSRPKPEQAEEKKKIFKPKSTRPKSK